MIRVPFDDWLRMLATGCYEGVNGVFFNPIAHLVVVSGGSIDGSKLSPILDGKDPA